MKYSKLENPDHKFDNIIVEKLGWNNTNSVYFLKYYDLTINSKMYTILDNNFIRNPYKIDNLDDIIYNCQYLSTEILPTTIKCIEGNETNYKQIVCLDVYNYQNEFYIDNRIYTKIYINDCQGTKEINGLLCHRILYETVKKFHKLQTSRNIYYVNIITINEPENIFTYYHDITNDKYYIKRDIYEQLKKYEIEIKTKPQIIDNKNTYSIEKDKLNEFCDKSKLVGKEIQIKLDKEVEKKTIVIYKDKENNKLYIKQSDYDTNNSIKIINNLVYKEITEDELSNIDKYIITTIYLKKEKQLDLIIHTYNRIKYIEKDIIKMFNINPTNRKKIKVNGIINYAVSEHEINVITQSVNTKISYKNIVPTNK